MKKKILAVILAAIMAVCLLPTAAVAAGESDIQLGTVGLKLHDEIYFGSYTDGTAYDLPWIALDTSGFLLSKYLLGNLPFEVSGSGYYSGSTLNTHMDALYNGEGISLFTLQERVAIKTVASLVCLNINGKPSAPVADAHLFPLSYEEANALSWGNDILMAPYITNQSGDFAYWWLRTSGGSTWAYYITEYGDPLDASVLDGGNAARPAFNLDLSRVLFTSAAAGGKSASGMDSGLTAVAATTPSVWKLTLLDDSRTFSAATTAYDSTNKIVTVSYSGATVGANEYISAIIKNSSGNITYYGRVAQPTGSDGRLAINLSGKYSAGDTLQVFSEQYNGDKKTDLASAFADVSLTPNAYGITNNLTNIVSDNTSTYHLMSNMGDYTATLSVSGSYALPATITVKIGETTNASFSYNAQTGAIIIPYESFRNGGDIIITAAGFAPHTHSWDSTWSKDTENHWHACACGDKKDTAPHSYDGGKITTKPTETETGIKTYTCSVCGFAKRDVVAKLPPTNVPQTGDSGMIPLLLGLIFASVVGFLAIHIKTRKKHRAR